MGIFYLLEVLMCELRNHFSGFSVLLVRFAFGLTVFFSGCRSGFGLGGSRRSSGRDSTFLGSGVGAGAGLGSTVGRG